VPYYAIYLLLGIILWGFFSELTSQGLPSIVVRAPLLRRVNFPRYVIVLSVGASVLISFLLNLLVMALFMLLMRVPVRLEILWIIPLFLELVAFSVSVALFLSALYVRLQDLTYIWEVFLQAAFYATPIIYPLSLVPNRWASVLVLNPVAQIMQDARYVLVTDQAQTISELWGTPWARAIPVGITLILAVGSVIFFRRRSRTFAEEA
jgi:ABC-2 type transport system permease protein